MPSQRLAPQAGADLASTIPERIAEFPIMPSNPNIPQTRALGVGNVRDIRKAHSPISPPQKKQGPDVK